MSKLTSLCRKLSRQGVNCAVLSHARGDYTVVYSFSPGWYSSRNRRFSTVRECEQFLLTLFR